MGMDTISPMEAISYIGKPDVLFVDIRDAEDYRRGHIPGAKWMQVEELLRHREMLKKHRMVIICCERGNASLLAARELRDLPNEIRSIAYGISEYHGPLTGGRY